MRQNRATNNQSPRRDLGLDVLRGVAILLVLLHHAILHGYESGKLGTLVNSLERFGWTGVDLFFVLSGFLIGGLLFKELRTTSRLDVRRFLIRRTFKIWPGYFALLAFVFVKQLRHTNSGPAVVLQDLLPNLLHVQNYFGTLRGHTWSLSVEEHFYLLLPLVLVGLTWKREKPLKSIPALPFIAISLALICLGLRIWTHISVPFKVETHRYPTHLRIDSLFWGVMLGYLREFHPVGLARIFQHRTAALVGGLVLVSPMLLIDVSTCYAHTLGFTALFLGYGCVIMAFVHAPEGSGHLSKLIYSTGGRAFGFVGTFSYSIYLWHADLAQLPLIERYHLVVPASLPAELRWFLVTLVYVALATGSGVLMAKLIEQPALALRNRLFPARSEASAGAEPLPTSGPGSDLQLATVTSAS